MKFKKIFIISIIIISFSSISYATSEIINSQMEALNISSFIREGEKYTKTIFPDLDLKYMLNSAISGEIDNSLLYKGIMYLFGEEILDTLTLFCSILIIIIIHSILKSISENIGNENISQIAYYIEYILIVTLIMANFSELIDMIRNSITDIVGIMNTLIPILLSLMITTRKYCINRTNSTDYFVFSNFRG